MMKGKILAFLFPVVLMAGAAAAQIREIPKIVMETFSNQYPKASGSEFRDMLVKVEVSFELEGDHMVATYSNKGLWKGTEKDMEFDGLEEDIRTGFEKSRFADWDVEETRMLYLPGGSTQYRILAAKSDIQKKYLYFNTKGQLLREALTL